MKHRTAFTVTLTTDEPYSAREMAKQLRLLLSGHLFWHGEPGKRKHAIVKKVTVGNLGER